MSDLNTYFRACVVRGWGVWRDRIRGSLIRLGVDRAVYFVVVGRLWLTLAGVANMVAIGLWLSPVEQGYYYTFVSVLTAQVFFELGLTSVVMQFASHESHHLHIDQCGHLVGNANAKSRLSSIVRLSLRWYGVMAALFVLVLGPIGYFFFLRSNHAAEHVAWLWPWICLVVANAAILWLSPLFAILEGCGLVAEVAKFRLVQSIFAQVGLWAALAAHRGVQSPAVLSIITLVAGIAWVGGRYGSLFVDLLREKQSSPQISWRREMLPYQWRIAVSYASGYFMAQFFTPILFAYRGAAEAGQMGMSLSATGVVSTLSLAWITTKAPKLGGLVAQRKFTELNKVFAEAFKRTLGISATATCLLIGGILMINFLQLPLATRFLPPMAFVPLVLSTLVSVVVTGMAIYLRAFKREPFLVISILNGLLISLSTIFLGRQYGAIAITAGYLVVNALVGLGLGWYIFANKRHSWTQAELTD